MYFINFARCSVCNQKKSVAINKKTLNRKICSDCNREYYEEVSLLQKERWMSKGLKK